MPLASALRATPEITEYPSDAEIQPLTDPENYLGSARRFINQEEDAMISPLRRPSRKRSAMLFLCSRQILCLPRLPVESHLSLSSSLAKLPVAPPQYRSYDTADGVR
jgi:hypothetical protein